MTLENDPFMDPWNPVWNGGDGWATPGGGDGGAPPNWSGAGQIMSLGGSAMSAIAGYFQAQSQKNQLRSQELAAEFQATMSMMNQRAAEHDANVAILDGQTQVAMAGLQAKAEKGSAEAAMGASGFEVSGRSNAEIRASMDWAKEADRHTITLNSFGAARAARMQAVNYGNQAMALRTSAQNLRASRRTIQPWAQAAGGAMSGVGQFLYRPRYR